MLVIEPLGFGSGSLEAIGILGGWELGRGRRTGYGEGVDYGGDGDLWRAGGRGGVLPVDR